MGGDLVKDFLPSPHGQILSNLACHRRSRTKTSVWWKVTPALGVFSPSFCRSLVFCPKRTCKKSWQKFGAEANYDRNKTTSPLITTIKWVNDTSRMNPRDYAYDSYDSLMGFGTFNPFPMEGRVRFIWLVNVTPSRNSPQRHMANYIEGLWKPIVGFP